MDNKYDKQLLIIQATVKANNQEANEKQMNANDKNEGWWETNTAHRNPQSFDIINDGSD